MAAETSEEKLAHMCSAVSAGLHIALENPFL